MTVNSNLTRPGQVGLRAITRLSLQYWPANVASSHESRAHDKPGKLKPTLTNSNSNSNSIQFNQTVTKTNLILLRLNYQEHQPPPLSQSAMMHDNWQRLRVMINR